MTIATIKHTPSNISSPINDQSNYELRAPAKKNYSLFFFFTTARWGIAIPSCSCAAKIIGVWSGTRRSLFACLLRENQQKSIERKRCERANVTLFRIFDPRREIASRQPKANFAGKEVARTSRLRARDRSSRAAILPSPRHLARGFRSSLLRTPDASLSRSFATIVVDTRGCTGHSGVFTIER